MLPRCSWTHPRRADLLADNQEILEEGPCRALRFRLVAISPRWKNARRHPDGRHWCREVSLVRGTEGPAIWKSSTPPAPAPGLTAGPRSHLLTADPSPADLEILGWALVTTREGTGPPQRRLLLHPAGGLERLREYLDDEPPEDLDALYLRVLRLSVRDLNDASTPSSREARAAGVVLPWGWEGRQVEIERVSMACHYRLASLAAEKVHATLSPFSLQVFSYTALHSTSPVLEQVAGAFTRWRFVQPYQRDRDRPEWGRVAATNLSTLACSRELFSAFESPGFLLCQEQDPVRDVMAASSSLLVLAEKDAYTEQAKKLSAGAPVVEIPREAYR